jgi:hypothetical protein
MGTYSIAQICLNGHCISPSVDRSPERSQNHCRDCGAKTITQCPACNENINGTYNVPGVVAIGFEYHVPSYCHNCGKPYPWTNRAIEAAEALIDEDDGLSPDEKGKLSESLTDIITETPKTQLASARFKKAFMVAGRFTAEGLRQFAIDFGCELAKKQLGI